MAKNNFQDIVKAYLDKRAAEDHLFAPSYAKEDKNIKDCCSYITSLAKKQASNGCAAISDDVVFGWAVHYYDEDDIKVGSKVNCKVVVNHAVELTEEEKEQARQAAIQKIQDEAISKMRKQAAKPKKKVENVEQPSLFD